MKKLFVLFFLLQICISGHGQKGAKTEYIVYFHPKTPAKTKQALLEKYLIRTNAKVMSSGKKYDKQSVFLISISSQYSETITPCVECSNPEIGPCCMITIPNEAITMLGEPCVHCGPRCCLGFSNRELQLSDPNPVTLYGLYTKIQQGISQNVSRIILGVNVNNKNKANIKNFLQNIASQPNAQNTKIVRVMVNK
ncbi:hypothetical protein [Runella sp. SP2]|uniref:hypothetical protein n=1 Tax=Runella sp. SP2 TaxID=2268026 RepID=UPI0013DDC3F7|nr:hypothetical protein [Runella sp. SP2]